MLIYMHTEEFFDNQFTKTIELINDSDSTINQIINHINKYSNFNRFIIKLKQTQNDNKILLIKFYLLVKNGSKFIRLY